VKLEPLITLPSAWTFVWQRLGAHFFQGTLTVPDMDRLELEGDRWHAAHPGRLLELIVIFPSDARMNGEERERMVRLIKRREKARVASATVVLAEGIAGAMHRSVLTGLTLIARPPHPTKVCANLADAVAFLMPHLRALTDPRLTTSEVLAGLDQAKSAFEARNAAPAAVRRPSRAG
jgi:hypothetical protein